MSVVKNLSRKKLLGLLGVGQNEQGNVPVLELFGACLQAQNNPRIQALPKEEREIVIRSTSAIADALIAAREGD